MRNVDEVVRAAHASLVLRELRAAVDNLHADLLQARAHVRRLVRGQCLDALVKSIELQLQRAELIVKPHRIRTAEVRLNVRAGDEGLRRNAVEEHGGTTGPLLLNERDVGAVLGAGRCGLVPGGATADDDNARGVFGHLGSLSSSLILGHFYFSLLVRFRGSRVRSNGARMQGLSWGRVPPCPRR